MEIPIYYDPMIAKLVVHGANRQEAINRMLRAIQEYTISGIETTLDFCSFVLRHEAFVSGNFDTKFVEKYFKPDQQDQSGAAIDENDALAAVLAAHIFSSHKVLQKDNRKGTVRSKWKNRK